MGLASLAQLHPPNSINVDVTSVGEGKYGMALTLSPSVFSANLNSADYKKIVTIKDCKKKSIATIYYDVAYDFFFHLINSVTMETNHEYMNTIII